MNRSTYESTCCSASLITPKDTVPYGKYKCSVCEKQSDYIGILKNHTIKKNIDQFIREEMCDHKFEGTPNCINCGIHLDELEKRKKGPPVGAAR